MSSELSDSAPTPTSPSSAETSSTNATSSSTKNGPKIIAALVVLLLILHQDNWLWNNDTLVFGFIPIGLFYHACLSVAATLVWFTATKIAWPDELIEETKLAVAAQRAAEANEGGSSS